ncbi:MAG TPA: hypothetical protein VG294_06850, partial [Solirubrobacteraceae bacterium]|nr:hypothetical protein [Solirubrobacteraceae bacterium]
GYMVPWGWTGFSGNRVWDWLELILLPLVIALAPIFPEVRASWTRRRSLLTLTGAALFGAVVLGGYLGGWRWTGFHGNTAWDWLHLLLLPLLLPTVVVPALMPLATAGVVYVKEEAPSESAPEPEPEPTGDPAPAPAGDPATG